MSRSVGGCRASAIATLSNAQAQSRDLEGWVRNRRDGSVEAVFAGPADAVTAVIAACRRGPSSARVETLRDEAGNPDMLKLREAGERFSVLPTI